MGDPKGILPHVTLPRSVDQFVFPLAYRREEASLTLIEPPQQQQITNTFQWPGDPVKSLFYSISVPNARIKTYQEATVFMYIHTFRAAASESDHHTLITELHGNVLTTPSFISRDRNFRIWALRKGHLSHLVLIAVIASLISRNLRRKAGETIKYHRNANRNRKTKLIYFLIRIFLNLNNN